MSTEELKYDDEDYVDPVEELQANMDQFNIIKDGGEVTSSSVITDYYKPIKLDGRTYRTHAVFVDVMVE